MIVDEVEKMGTSAILSVRKVNIILILEEIHNGNTGRIDEIFRFRDYLNHVGGSNMKRRMQFMNFILYLDKMLLILNRRRVDIT